MNSKQSPVRVKEQYINDEAMSTVVTNADGTQRVFQGFRKLTTAERIDDHHRVAVVYDEDEFQIYKCNLIDIESLEEYIRIYHPQCTTMLYCEIIQTINL